MQKGLDHEMVLALDNFRKFLIFILSYNALWSDGQREVKNILMLCLP